MHASNLRRDGTYYMKLTALLRRRHVLGRGRVSNFSLHRRRGTASKRARVFLSEKFCYAVEYGAKCLALNACTLRNPNRKNSISIPYRHPTFTWRHDRASSEMSLLALISRFYADDPT